LENPLDEASKQTSLRRNDLHPSADSQRTDVTSFQPVNVQGEFPQKLFKSSLLEFLDVVRVSRPISLKKQSWKAEPLFRNWGWNGRQNRPTIPPKDLSDKMVDAFQPVTVSRWIARNREKYLHQLRLVMISPAGISVSWKATGVGGTAVESCEGRRRAVALEAANSALQLPM
jgi:hypothetical protein